MKKIFLVLIGAMMIGAMSAQVVEQNEPALVYYSPKTAVTVDFTYIVEKQEPGIYAQYAEAMIGATEAVKENKTTYRLDKVRIGTKTSTDYTRPHKVVADATMPMLFRINENGLLMGYNLPPYEKPAFNRPKPDDKPDGKCHKGCKGKVTPLPEEVLKAANPLAQANAVAKQIFHLRETRMYLINGEVEHAPADGEAMRMVLEELDRQEQALTELFIGKKSKKTEHKFVTFLPEEQHQIWYFSEENGFTDAENIDANTIVASIAVQPQQYAPASTDKKKKTAEPSQFVYNLPGNGEVKVLYKGQEMAKRTIAVAQAGVDVALPKETFKGNDLPVIVVNEKTGNIVSISK